MTTQRDTPPRGKSSAKPATGGRRKAAASSSKSGTASASASRRGQVQLGKGRGDVRKALDRAIAEARGEDRMTAEHEVRALVACRLADVVDRASRDSDAARLQSAADDLLEVLDTLPIRKSEHGGAGGGGERGKLLTIIDSPPTKDASK